MSSAGSTVLKPCCRKAGGIDHPAVRRRACTSRHGAHRRRRQSWTPAPLPGRLRKDIAEVFGHASDLVVLAPGGLRKGNLVRRPGAHRWRQPGPADRSGGQLRTAGARAAPASRLRPGLRLREAAWRGAFLAHGSLTEPWQVHGARGDLPWARNRAEGDGRSRPAAQDSRQGARRPGDRSRGRPGRGDSISALLTRLGAHDSVLAWEERRIRREVRATANRLANFDDANLRRSAPRCLSPCGCSGRAGPWRSSAARRA